MNLSEIDTTPYDCRVEHRLSGRTLHNYECQHATPAEAQAHAERLMRHGERGHNVVVRPSNTGVRP